jgi:hypothetical protein
MRSRLIRKTGFILGLLAILMMTLAPAISQVHAAHAHAGMSMPGAFCPAHSAPDDAPSSEKSSLHHGDACGYCSFFTHAAALPSVPVAFALAVRAIQHRIVTRFQSVRRVLAMTSAQPRAPPSAS